MPEEKLSFIPKRTSNVPAYGTGGGFGVFFVFSFLVFLLSVSFTAGTYFYRDSLKKEINSMGVSLEKAKDDFEPSLVYEIVNTSEKIDSIKKLFEQRTTLVPLFDFLEKTTIKTVKFNNFKYSFGEGDGSEVVVTMDGVAKNYSVLAVQSNIFERERAIKEVSFSGFNLGSKGLVNFVTKITFDRNFINFKEE